MAILGGSDDRVLIPDHGVTNRPFSAVVSIMSVYPDDTITYGSGAMIGPDDLLTAAHCVYRSDYGGWANVYAFPALTPSGLTFPGARDENIWTNKHWVGYEQDSMNFAFNHDYAYVDLDAPVGFQTGWLDIESGGWTGSLVETVGYPGDYGSEQMVYSSGTVDQVSGNVFEFYDDLDSYRGQSGSPVFLTDSTGEIDIVGIVSHEGYWPVDMNGVLKLNSYMVNQINDWADNSINSPSQGGISETPTFNEDWYLNQNTDVANAVRAGWFNSGEQHWKQYGWKEGRDPCETFSTKFYLTVYPDVAAAGMNPLEHYQKWGESEGRWPQIDEAAYLARYTDVDDKFSGTASQHYAQYGRNEGRRAEAPEIGYDESDYLISNINDFTSSEVALAGVEELPEMDFAI